MTAHLTQDLVALLPRLRRFALSLTGTTADADDVVQAACERAIRCAHQWQPGSRLDSWLYRIIQTTWLDMRRSGRRTSSLDDMDTPDSGAPAPAETHIYVGQVGVALNTLPADQRAVLTLVCIEGLSYREAAEALDIPAGTVMSRLARARVALRDLLEEAAP